MLALYVSTLLLTATLLFLVEPLVAKTLLPVLGGGPIVWTTCVAFFQLALLFGYLYAHLALRWLPTRRQALLHVALLAAAWATLPFADASQWAAPAGHQALWLFGRLTLLIGLPFVLLSASAPLLQRWLATTSHRDARDPYFLYAASNAGSLFALLCYPVVLEPAIALSKQRDLWAGGFGLALVLFLACAISVRRSRAPAPVVTAPGAPTPTWHQRIRWLVLAMVPASLLLSVTSYASTDLAALPLLWVVPLALYLLTFVIAFSRRPVISAARALWLQPFFLLPLAIEFFWKIQGAAWPLIPFHLIGFSVCALVCHQALADSRPPSGSLTEFYLWVSVGGALGGLFNVLVAPQIFSTVLEYPLGIVAAALIRPGQHQGRLWRRDIALSLGFFALLCGVTILLHVWQSRLGLLGTLLVVGPTLCAAGVLGLHARDRPLRFGLVIAAIVGAGLLHAHLAARPVFTGRSFFAAHSVRDENQRRILSHGNTVHGLQHLTPARRREGTTYYHRTGPIGQIMEAWRGTALRLRIAIVGLGTGTIASYSDPGERWTYYEIDPVVIDLARDRRLFTFVADAHGAIDIIRGDARLSLKAVPDREFGMIVVDAFTSDAIPAHLLTQEAIALYLRKLMEQGVVVFHISNRYLDLRSVVASGARSLGLVSLSCQDTATPEEVREGKMSSRYMVVARRAADLARLTIRQRCKPADDVVAAKPSTEKPWTDDLWSLWPVLHFRWSETFDFSRLRFRGP